MPVDTSFTLSGFLVGLIVGLTGVGGGSLMTPVLILVFGIHPATAVGTDLLYASVTKTAGTLIHGISRTVEWRAAGRLAAGSVPATAVTLFLMAWFRVDTVAIDAVITAVLSVALCASAAALIFRARIEARFGNALASVGPEQTRYLTVLAGGMLGVLVSLSSVGAGALGVTVLMLLYPRLPMSRIVGTDIAHAVPLTLVAGFGHWWLGLTDIGILGLLLVGSLPGIMLGSYIAPRISDRALRYLLAATLLLVGGRLAL